MLAGDATLLLKFLGMKFFLSFILGIETIFMENFKVFCMVLMKDKSSPHTQKIEPHDGKNVVSLMYFFNFFRNQL